MSYNKKPKTINPDEVDPSVYYYDEVYDDMKDEEQKEREEKQSGYSSKSKGSLYIKGLQETAEIRKTEKELRRFKKYTKDSEETDRPKEGEDVYVTAGYKRKLTEIKNLEEEKRRRLDKEKNDSMNFLKKYKSDVDKKIDDRDSKEAFACITKSTERNLDKSNLDNDRQEIIGPQPMRPKKELKTFKERKEYLRKVLAKRTIGKVFEDAVKRYKERKAISSR